MTSITRLCFGIWLLSSSCFAALPADPLPSCLAPAMLDARLTIISDKVSLLSPDVRDFQMLADATRPTPEERAAIGVWADKRAQCYKEVIPFYRTHYYDIITARLVEYQGEFLSLAADLYNGQTTFGEFNRYRKAAADRFVRDMARIDADLDSMERQDARAARQEQAARDARYQNSIRQIEERFSKSIRDSRPIETNCSWSGSQWNCLSK